MNKIVKTVLCFVAILVFPLTLLGSDGWVAQKPPILVAQGMVNVVDDDTLVEESEGEEYEGEQEDYYTYYMPDVAPEKLTLAQGDVWQLDVRARYVQGNDAGETRALSEDDLDARFQVSDKNVAKVSAKGLITALAPGQTTISVAVFLRANKTADEINETQVSMGKTDVLLRVVPAARVDDDDATPMPRQVMVNAKTGGAVRSVTGETVLIAEEAFAKDQAVGIVRIDLEEVEDRTGIKAPGENRGHREIAAGGQIEGDLLRAVGAFTLQIPEAAQIPLQLAIPLQGGFRTEARDPKAPDDGIAHAGDMVYFFRRGTILNAKGVEQETWWLLAEGVIGEDGIARTSGISQAGIMKSGEYVVSRMVMGNQRVKITGYGNQVIHDDWAGMALSFTRYDLTFPALRAETRISGFFYDILDTPPEAFPVLLPPLPESGMQEVALPQPKYLRLDQSKIPNLEIDARTLVFNRKDGRFEFRLRAFDPDALPKGFRLVLELWDASRNSGGKVLASRTVSAVQGKGLLTINQPPTVAVGNTGIRVRQVYATISVDEIGQRNENQDRPALERKSAAITPFPLQNGIVGAQLTRTEASFYWMNAGNRVDLGSLSFDKTGGRIPGKLTGDKVDAVVISDDFRAFIAGEGQVWAVDLLAMRVHDVFPVGEEARNIMSLAINGDYLYIAEGGYEGKGVHRLWFMVLNPSSSRYGKVIPIETPNRDLARIAPHGYSSMVLNPTGATMILAPLPALSEDKSVSKQPGKVIVLDLYHGLDRVNGQLKEAIVAELSGDGGGFDPRHVRLTHMENGIGASNIDFLVTNAQDTRYGLATLKIDYDDKRRVARARFKSMEPSLLEQLGIQRIRDAIGVIKMTGNRSKYAIVSGDSLDSAGTGTGGRLAVIKDPFEEHPVFLGTTAPQEGMRYDNLSLAGTALLVHGMNLRTRVGHTLAVDLNTLLETAEALEGSSNPPGNAIPLEFVTVQTARAAGEPVSSALTQMAGPILLFAKCGNESPCVRTSPARAPLQASDDWIKPGGIQE
jgi:hypothetical protein